MVKKQAPPSDEPRFVVVVHDGVKLPVWRETGMVPLSSVKVTLASGVRPGEVCGLKPEKALPFIASGVAQIFHEALAETGLDGAKIAASTKIDEKAEDPSKVEGESSETRGATEPVDVKVNADDKSASKGAVPRPRS